MRASSLLILAGASALAAAAAPAAAQRGPLLSATDGRWLAGACASTRPADRSYCYGYVAGVADQLALQGAMCRPANANADQIVGTVRGHLAASGPDLGRHATFLIRRVLTAAYPCRR